MEVYLGKGKEKDGNETELRTLVDKVPLGDRKSSKLDGKLLFQQIASDSITPARQNRDEFPSCLPVANS